MNASTTDGCMSASDNTSTIDASMADTSTNGSTTDGSANGSTNSSITDANVMDK